MSAAEGEKMKTIFEHIREGYYKRAGIDTHAPKSTVTEVRADIAEKRQWVAQMVKLELDRLFMGTIRYGIGKDAHLSYDYGKEILVRWKRYYKTKNLECLVDARNFCLLEFFNPHVEGAFFEAQDDVGHTQRIKLQ